MKERSKICRKLINEKMSFKQQFRSLTREERDRFREFNKNERRAIRGYINISGDSLAPFVSPSIDVFGVGQETYGLSDGPNDIFFTASFLPGNAFSEFAQFDLGFIPKTDPGDTFRFSPEFEYEVVRGSGSRRGYLIYQLDDQGRGQFPRELLAVVGGRNDVLETLSSVSGPLSSTDFLS